jgi:hypothetical protein
MDSDLTQVVENRARTEINEHCFTIMYQGIDITGIFKIIEMIGKDLPMLCIHITTPPHHNL